MPVPYDPAPLAARFHARFLGLDRAHGHAVPKTTAKSNGKQEAKHDTIHEPATPAHWVRHLLGEYSLGIVPVRDDATACFGAIDIDNYNLDLGKLAEDVQRAGLPLILCRTKSGGAHLYTFVTAPVPAELVRGKLMEWAVLLGHSGVEVFPKQTRLAGPNDFGSWINMPYFGGISTQRYAVVEGKPLTPEQFLDLADLMALTPSGLKDFEPEAITEFQEWLEEGPPCLQSLAKKGFGEGGRNKGLFNIGVYLRKRYEDDWEQRLDQYNQKFLDPPIGHKEVTQIVKNLQRKNYSYTCNDHPIVSVCNRQICLSRRFGVGGQDDDPGVVFGGLLKVKTDPPLWIMDVDGARIELNTQELKDQARFQSRCIEVLNKWPMQVKPKKWATIIRERLAAVEVQEVPPDATQEGQMWAHLNYYCTTNPAAAKEDMLRWRPWTDKEDDRTHFSASHFRQYLEQQRLRVDEKTLWKWLRKRGATHHFHKIKGKGINTWAIPAFEAQTEDFATPQLEEL